MSKEEIVSVVKEALAIEGITTCEELTPDNIVFYYEGICEEDFSHGGTVVTRCPVWYARLEQLSIAVYQLATKICVSLRIFAENVENILRKDVFIERA